MSDKASMRKLLYNIEEAAKFHGGQVTFPAHLFFKVVSLLEQLEEAGGK